MFLLPASHWLYPAEKWTLISNEITLQHNGCNNVSRSDLQRHCHECAHKDAERVPILGELLSPMLKQQVSSKRCCLRATPLDIGRGLGSSNIYHGCRFTVMEMVAEAIYVGSQTAMGMLAEAAWTYKRSGKPIVRGEGSRIIAYLKTQLAAVSGNVQIIVSVIYDRTIYDRYIRIGDISAGRRHSESRVLRRESPHRTVDGWKLLHWIAWHAALGRGTRIVEANAFATPYESLESHGII
jgi:hypothetical protein